jgi:hypothetical protein
MTITLLSAFAALVAFASTDVGTHLSKAEVEATLKALPPNSGTEQMLPR